MIWLKNVRVERRTDQIGHASWPRQHDCREMQSGRGLPHSKTLARETTRVVIPAGIGVQHSSAAMDCDRANGNSVRTRSLIASFQFLAQCGAAAVAGAVDLKGRAYSNRSASLSEAKAPSLG